MVVDNRYKRVAQGKSRLSKLFVAQFIVQLLSTVNIVSSSREEESLIQLAASSLLLGIISLTIGESGRRRSRVNFLKCSMIGSSISLLLSIACVIRRNHLLEVLKDFSSLGTSKLELSVGAVLLGSIVQILAVSTTISLIRNMKPPTRGS